MPSPSFLAAVRRHAQQRPTALALISDQQSVTYRELFSRATALRVELHLGGTDVVCVRAHKSVTAVALVLANLLSGRPVLLASAELGAESLTALATRAGATHIVSVAEDGALEVEPTGVGMSDGVVDADVGLLLTTSGSTGVPKVVPLSFEAVDRFMEWAATRFEIESGARILSYAPLNFDLCLLELWATLRAGACAVLVDHERAADGAYLRELITANDVHLVQGVPLLYRLLHDADGAPWSADTRHVLFTGDVLPEKLLAVLPDLFPRAGLYNVYGCTETNDSFLHEVDARGERTPIPLGRPISGVRAYLAGQDGEVLDGPGTGELVVHTPFQTRGYLDPMVGEGRFFVRADADGPRTYYRSGDLVRRDADGTLNLVGRNDFQVKVRGVRINVQEVEDVILAHPDVAEAAVVALPDELAGHLLYALVRRAPGVKLGSLALRAHCAERLVRTAIPAEVKVVDSALPKGPTGKVDRGAIRKKF
ncbi:AMP-binding protein [Nocardia sp. NPDC052566]|uniref:AMP-binding protein n=1 Tax=Nocardia sp. NPDC052566 TaxID=3364330 RepID=UPI0037C8EB2C